MSIKKKKLPSRTNVDREVKKLLRKLYRDAALAAKRTDNLQQECIVWKWAIHYIDIVILALTELHNFYPDYISVKSFRFAFNYRRAVEKRFFTASEFIQDKAKNKMTADAFEQIFEQFP